MRFFVAMSGTWGGSGLTFDGIYTAVAIFVGVVAVVIWHSATRSVGGAPASSLEDPYEIAYLHGGPELTVLTALTALHVAGLVTPAGRGRLQAAGAIDTHAGELERAIHLSACHPVRRTTLPKAAPVAEVLRHVEGRLVGAGLLLTSTQCRRLHWTGWMLWAVAAVGTIPALTGGQEARFISTLIMVLIAMAMNTFHVAESRHTGRGTDELTRLRAAHACLSPELHPDWRVYGSAGVALGVAVFGASAIWAADPVFAKELGTDRE